MALTRLDNLYSSKTGKYLYVSPDDFNATDELDNRGNSPLRPFKTIQRAFIEVARFSYLPGSDNDRFDQFSIMLMPGDHYIDNRPGVVQLDTSSRQRYYDARNLIQANRQEIIDRAFAEIAIEYDEVAWGVDWVVPGDDVNQDSSRYYDAYRLIQKNRKEVIDRAIAQIAIDWEDFNFPEDPVETEYSRYKDAYRLIQNNKTLIVNDVWALISAAFPSIGADQALYEKTVDLFIDSISLDVFNTGSNYYSRQFVIKYIDEFALGDPLNAAILAFDQAVLRMKAAITNTYVSDTAPGSEYQDLTVVIGNPVYDPGNAAGDVPNTDPTACSDVQTNIDNLNTTIKNPISTQDINDLVAETLGDGPASEAKCKRDLGFIVDYISLDVVQGGGNVYTRKVIQNYFTEDGNSWVDDGLQGEEDQSITAFNKARDVMLLALANQLYYQDLTVTHDSAGTGSGEDYDPAACADVQNFITNLFTYLTDAVSNGNTVALPAEEVGPLDPGESKCKRDIGYIVDAVAADLANGGNAQIIAATKAYYDKDGQPIDNGLVGEEAQSIVAFNRAAIEMQKAVTNQLLSKDLTILAGPAQYVVEGPNIPVLPSGNAAACVDVQNSIATLITVIVDTLSTNDLTEVNSLQVIGDIPIFNYNQALEEWNDNTILDLSNPDNALYKFNSSTGGAIVPRGCSLIGYDLRRTIVRPLYVPDPADATQERTSIFNLTGGCYLWQFTIKDGDLSSNSPLYNPTDKVGRVYFQKGNSTNLATPEYSHHKICIMTYADESDLEQYYDKVGRAFSLFQPTIDDGDLEALVQENRIVGPLSDTRNITNIRLEDNVDTSKVTVVVTTKIAHGYFKDQYVAIIDNGLNDLLNGTFKVIELDDTDPRIFKYEVNVPIGQLAPLDTNANGYDFNTVPTVDIAARVQAEIDSVESASPYVFNCSIRSTWGQCGMWADGSKATGFKSMVVAQYTGVSLQRDDRAYIRYDEFTNTWNQASITDAFATEPYHTRGDAYWKDDWRNFHIRASDDAFIQCVSVFAVGFFDHFLMESGGDMSITNSNSNFGNTSLHAIGFKGFSFNQDKGGYITDIVPVKTVDDSAFNEKSYKYYSLDAQLTKSTSNTTGKLYYGSDETYDPFDKPITSVEGFRLGAKTGEKLFLNLKGTGGGTQTYEAELSETGFQRYTASIETLNPDGLTIDNYAQDASNSIEVNKQFIQQEAYGYITQRYPYLLTKPGIEIGKCERDIGYFVDAVVQDLRVGGNIQTIQAAEAYYVGGGLAYIEGELNETLEALDYVRQLCIAAMRNYDILIRNCIAVNGESIVDVGDTSGLIIGMSVTEYEYNATNFEYGRLLPTAVPVTVNQSIPAGAYIKRIIDSTRIELGVVGSKLDDGLPVSAVNTNAVYLYFSLPQTGTLLDPDDYLSGAWAQVPAIRDSSIIQDQGTLSGPVDIWAGDNTYPECVNIASVISTYFDDINIVLNQGLQPVGPGSSEGIVELYLANKQFIAEEAVDRAKAFYPAVTLNNEAQLIADVIESIEAIGYNLTYGGNDRVFDRGVYYVANPSVVNGEETFTNYVYDQVAAVGDQVILQVPVIPIGIPGGHTFTQIFDNEIIGTNSGLPGVYDPNDFPLSRAFAGVTPGPEGEAQLLIKAGIGTTVDSGDMTGFTRTEPVVGASVVRVEPSVNTANLATRATLFTINTGGGVSDPHNWETGTPVRLVPRARAGTNPDKRVVRLPRGFETNTEYYVIAPGRTTQPENYADGATYPGIFTPDSSTKLMLARTKDNAAAGIYIYSSETDSVDPDVEIEIQQYVLDIDYSLHQYLTNPVPGNNTVLQTEVPHVFDVPGTGGPVQKIFFRTFGLNSELPQVSGGTFLDPNTYYYARFTTPKTFSVFTDEAGAISGATPIIFAPGIGENFYVFSDKRRSPVKFDAEVVNTDTTTGQWYIQTIPDLGNTDNIIDRLQTLGITFTDARTKNSSFTRLDDDREKEDRVYRLRYVIPRYARGVRDPLNGFVIKSRTDETRKLLAQRIVLEPDAGGSPDLAIFNVDFDTGGGTIQQQLGLADGDPGLNPDFDYDPYNLNQVKIVDSDQTDSKISFSIMSARQVDVAGNNRLELTVFNHSINNNALKNEKFVVVKIDAPQGGAFRFDALQATPLNRITWSGYSSGSGYVQGYFSPDGVTDHYLIIKAIESQNPIKYDRFATTRFAQPVLNVDNDPIFDINGNPIEIFATLQAKPDSTGSIDDSLSKSDKEDYLYSNKDANVLTMVPGDIITDDATNDYKIISVEDLGDFEDSFYIFDIDEIQRRIPDQQEGIYYLTCLRGNISPFPTGPGVGQNFRNFKFSQPISQLYPLNYKNDPLWFQVRPDGTRDVTQLDPPATICAADNYVHGLVRTNDSKNSETREVIEDLIQNPALSRYNYTIEAQSGNSSAGSEDRRISIAGDSIYPTERRLFVELRRPSIARSGNHTFEYLGFGPGNYSTGFPLRQEVVLSDTQDFYAQAKREDAGIVFYTGLNSNGDLYIGNRKINAITGEETFLESAELQETDDEEGDLGGLVTTFELPVVFEKEITVDGDAFFNNPVTITVEPSEPPALTVTSQIDFASGGDPTLDRSSFDFSPIPSDGDIILSQNRIYAAIFSLNPRGTVSLAGQDYSIRTHVDNALGNLPSNHTPDQELITVGTPVLFGNQPPKAGDILLKGEQVGKTGSLGWIYSNFYSDVTLSVNTIEGNDSSVITFTCGVGTSPSDLDIELGSVIKLTGFVGRFLTINGLREAENINDIPGGTFDVTIPGIIIARDNINDPVLLTGLPGEPTIEVGLNKWREVGVIGAEALRTDTELYGEFKLGVNTLARADHGIDGDQEEGFVSTAVQPRANLDVVGNAWFSGTALPYTEFISNETNDVRTYSNLDHALLVGGNSAAPGDVATFRISTTNNGRVGINTDFANLDATFVVVGDVRVTEDVVFESNLEIQGENITTTAQNFNIIPSVATNINFGNFGEFANLFNQTTNTQEINIGNIAGTQTVNIGRFSTITEFNLHSNAIQSKIDIGTVANNDSSYSSVIEMGGAYANNSNSLVSGSIFKIYSRFTEIDGDLRINAFNVPSVGISNLTTNAGTANIFIDTVIELNIGLSASDINIGALGGSTTINNGLEVLSSTTLFGDTTMEGGLNSGQFEIVRGSYGTPVQVHGAGDDIENFNIDLYKKTGISITLDTAGVETWGGPDDLSSTVFPGTSGVDEFGQPTYFLPISDVSILDEFVENQYILIDRTNSVAGQNVAVSPVGEQYSELLRVVEKTNLNDVGPDQLGVIVARAQNQITQGNEYVPGPDVDGNPATYRYLRDDHPDNAVLVKYIRSRNVSFIVDPLLGTLNPGDLDDISTGTFAGSLIIGDLFRLSPADNGTLGELTVINQINLVSNQLFVINDGGTPAITAFSVDSVTGETFINGELTLNNNLILEGSNVCDVEKLIVTDGTTDPDFEKFIVDSCDGQTFIRGDLRIGEANFDRFVVESDTGSTTITSGNLRIANDANDTQLILQNSTGNLTIAGNIRTEDATESIFGGPVTVEGGNFNVLADELIPLFPDLEVGDSIFSINNDGSIDFAQQSGFFAPSGARKWEYISGGIEFVDAVSNINYFIAPSSDIAIRLPENPTHGDIVRIVDVGGLLTYNISLRMRAPNGVRIQGDVTNSGIIAGLGSGYDSGGELVVQTPNASFGLVYLGSVKFNGAGTGAPVTQQGWWLLEI